MRTKSWQVSPKRMGKASMIGSNLKPRVYLERGHPVETLVRWGPDGGPRNVLIRRENGELVVRPFRGMRRLTHAAPHRADGLAGRGQSTGRLETRGG